MKKIRKAVIPAAGFGTRFLPATKATPKEMLPIVDKPTIQYIVEEALQSGIEEILIISGHAKRAIEDHFDTNPGLELHLEESHKMGLLNMVRSISEINIHYIRQKHMRGLGDAILCAQSFVADEPFAILLGDDVVYNLLAGTHTPLPENIYTLQVNDACLADDALLIDMCCTDGERITPFTTLVAPDRIRSIVTKNVKRLMSGSVTLLTDQYMLPTRVDGDTVYTHADQAPRFDFNGESLMNYLARNLRLDPVAIERLPAGARAVIAFIVDASGHIRRPCVVSSATPGIDRELMRTARLMPAWAPGTVGGKPANVWCMLPIVLKK